MKNWRHSSYLFIYIFFSENMIWHFMQILHFRQNVTNPVFWGKIRKIFQNVICWIFYPNCLAFRAETICYNSKLPSSSHFNRALFSVSDVATKLVNVNYIWCIVREKGPYAMSEQRGPRLSIIHQSLCMLIYSTISNDLVSQQLRP